jgi:hypothetical protein
MCNAEKGLEAPTGILISLMFNAFNLSTGRFTSARIK